MTDLRAGAVKCFGQSVLLQTKMKTGKIEEIRIEEIEEMETDTMSKLEKVFDTPNKKHSSASLPQETRMRTALYNSSWRWRKQVRIS